MRVAVVGGGVAGLGAAYVLSRSAHVELFEREPRLGGHANTVSVDGLALDTGFLVHNRENYPLLTRLFRELGVDTQASSMSFSVCCADCGLEYSGRRLYAQRRNLASVAFTRLVWEIGRWLRTAATDVEECDARSWSLAAFLDARGYSERFRRHFLVPLTSALWSSPPERALELPAGYVIRFFDNHGMLGFRRFAWRTVTGGSRTYVDSLARRLGAVHTRLPVRSVRRSGSAVLVRTDDDAVRSFDRVVVATHADEALALLEDPTEAERRALEPFVYTANDVTLHTDSSFLPRAQGARASWNYRTRAGGAPSVTYWLNNLQRLEAPRDYLVTLNEEIPAQHVKGRFHYAHPRFTTETVQAQRRLRELPPSATAFAGAYHGNGFHEDGLASGVRAAAALGARWEP